MAQELGKQLHEVLGWEGPTLHVHQLMWDEWFRMQNEAIGGKPESEEVAKAKSGWNIPDWQARVDASNRWAREEAARKRGGVVVPLKKGDTRTAADLLHSGVSRKEAKT